MNLINKDYKVFVTQKKIRNVVLVLLCICLVFTGVIGIKLGINSKKLAGYTNIESTIASKDAEMKEIIENNKLLDTQIAELDAEINAETPSKETLEAMSPNNILYNVLQSTNDGVKLHRVELNGGDMKVKGVSEGVDEIAALVQKLSKYYSVDIDKTQQVNSSNGLYYAFTINIGVKGGN